MAGVESEKVIREMLFAAAAQDLMRALIHTLRDNHEEAEKSLDLAHESLQHAHGVTMEMVELFDEEVPSNGMH